MIIPAVKMLRFCIVLTFLLVHAASAGIDLTLSPANSRPGDVVELRASMEQADYANFELKLPQHADLYLVDRQRQPVEYVDGQYRQESLWLLQPTRSGTIRVTGIQAVLHQQDGPVTLDLPELSIEVERYISADDSFYPEPWPDALEPPERVFFTDFLLIVGVIVLALLALRFRPKRAACSAIPSAAPSIESLLVATSAGQLPTESIAAILEDASLVLSPHVRSALERALYQRGADAGELARILKKEMQR
jgi:hypothetical protein